MTMKELARLANVSVSSVSKAFSDADDISPDTKMHIFEVAKRYGCYGKFYKGKYSKKIIAVICPELSSSYYTTFLEILKGLIETANGICIISADDFSATKQAELIEYYACYLKVDGLIVFGLKGKIKKGYDIPIVSLFSSIDANVDSINTDMESAIYEAVDTLISYGHKNIAFISEKLTNGKAESFKNAMFERDGIKATVIESDKRFEKAGADGIDRLLNSGEKSTAIICAYDNIAFGAIKQLKKAGYRVPQDISVIGIDNITAGEFAETSLTTIDTYPERVCEIAWDLLQKKLKNKYFTVKQNIIIKPQLILRESVARNE